MICFFALGLIWVTRGVIRVIWGFRPRSDMGFGYFKSDIVLCIFFKIAVCFLWLSLPGDCRVTDEALLAETT